MVGETIDENGVKEGDRIQATQPNNGSMVAGNKQYRKKEGHNLSRKTKIGRKWPHITHIVGCKGDSFGFFFLERKVD